jgi:pilus assembly protein CpaF
VPTGVRPRFTDRFDEMGIKLSPRVFGVAEPAGVRGWS